MHAMCLKAKFFNLAHSILENHHEIDLSEDNFQKVKELKIKTKKEFIKTCAEVEMMGIDIMAKLWDPNPDSNEINRLIEKKFEMKKERMKFLVNAFASLKKLVPKEQMEKLKKICRMEKSSEEEEKEKSCCR